MEKTNKIVFLGPPGSGKGTQAELLAKRMNLPQVIAGDLVRREIEVHTALGQAIEEVSRRGELVSDEIMIKLMSSEISRQSADQGMILDGYPRDLIQAQALEKIFKPTAVILINISDREAIERISGRRVCPVCGAVYHLKYNPPLRDEICDRCSEKLVIRADDTEEAVKKRLEIYHRETEPLIYYYKQRGILLEINGEQSIEKVQAELIRKLGI